MEENLMHTVKQSGAANALLPTGRSRLDKATIRAVVGICVLVTASGGFAHAAAPNPCDPLTYGAVADGVTDNTVAIQTAIDTCAAQGGGTVPFDSGVFLTGPFTLKSHILLRVNAGATILGTTDQSRYVPAFIGTRYRPNEALISTADATDVGIIGDGTIDGQGGVTPPGGASWYALARSARFPYTSFPFAPSSNGLPRPWLVEFWNTDHVVVQGVHLQNSPMWTLVPRYATNVTIAGITDSAPSTSSNTDAVDVVSSSNVTISNVNFASGDDDVAIKSGLPPTYQDPNAPAMPQAPSQFVTVANATFTAGHGMSIGSEAINGAHDILITNVALSGTSNGFRIKTGRDRGSHIQDITVQNLTMTNVAQPIVINSYYPASSPPPCCTDPAQPITATTPFVSNISIQNLAATGATSQSFISGLPESSVLNVTLKNVTIGQASNRVKPMDLRYMTGCFTGVTVSPTTTGNNFIVDSDSNGPTVTWSCGPPSSL
jgi:polygalacturonase